MATGQCPSCGTPNEYTVSNCIKCGAILPWSASVAGGGYTRSLAEGLEISARKPVQATPAMINAFVLVIISGCALSWGGIYLVGLICSALPFDSSHFLLGVNIGLAGLASSTAWKYSRKRGDSLALTLWSCIGASLWPIGGPLVLATFIAPGIAERRAVETPTPREGNPEEWHTPR